MRHRFTRMELGPNFECPNCGTRCVELAISFVCEKCATGGDALERDDFCPTTTASFGGIPSAVLFNLP
jgi:hypothetical protein